MSGGGRLFVKIAVGSALSLVNPGFGTLAALNSGFYEKFKDESFVSDIKKLKINCELLAIKEVMGMLQIYVVVLGDEMTEEALIGRSAIIHGLAEQMKRYSMTMFKSRFSEAKLGVHCAMFLVFSNHQKAKSFYDNHSRKCRHSNGNVFLFPFVADLEDGEIKYAGSGFFGLSYWSSLAGKMSKEIFRK